MTFFVDIHEARDSTVSMSHLGGDIERIERPSPEALQGEIARRDRPLIITGVADRWPALQKWNLEYFRSRFGDFFIDIITQRSRDPQVYWQEQRTIHTTMASFLAGIEQRDPRQYLNLWNVLAQLPELRPDLSSLHEYHCFQGMFDRPYPDTVKQKLRVPETLWIGPGGVFTPLHRDPAHNLLVQIMGQKRVVLYAPGHEKLLYSPWHGLCTVNRCLGGYSPIDVESPDLDQFPLFRYASALECTLGPGDMLYVPRLWWHFVIARDTTISLSSWWFRSITHWKASTAAWTPRTTAVRCWMHQSARRTLGRMLGRTGVER